MDKLDNIDPRCINQTMAFYNLGRSGKGRGRNTNKQKREEEAIEKGFPSIKHF